MTRFLLLSSVLSVRGVRPPGGRPPRRTHLTRLSPVVMETGSGGEWLWEVTGLPGLTSAVVSGTPHVAGVHRATSRYLLLEQKKTDLSFRKAEIDSTLSRCRRSQLGLGGVPFSSGMLRTVSL